MPIPTPPAIHERDGEYYANMKLTASTATTHEYTKEECIREILHFNSLFGKTKWWQFGSRRRFVDAILLWSEHLKDAK